MPEGFSDVSPFRSPVENDSRDAREERANPSMM
jgi:hypothetical protein